MNKKSKRTRKWRPGVKVNYLSILKIYKGPSGQEKAVCECVCGKVKEFYLSNITPKPNCRYTVSCGCKKSEIVSRKKRTHGLSGTKFYKHWRSMFDRLMPSYICHKSYKDVSISDRWKQFENFKEDMYESWLAHEAQFGGRQTTLDRINVFGNYCKENCRWATQREQGLNKRTNSSCG